MIVDAAFIMLCALGAVPSAVLFVEAVSAVMWRGNNAPAADLRHGPVAVLVPAHNEERGLGATLANIFPQLRDGDRILVVADNCTDDTAKIAAAHGAQVLERHDTLRRGKGYALDFGLNALSSDPPKVVAVIDADCRLAEGSLHRLAAICVATGQPAQSLNLMKAPKGEEARFAVAEFAWVVRNQVRPLGLAHLGLPCQLTGTGMAFPWTLIDKVDFASGNVVEDLELGVNLARAGTPPRFCPEAYVESEFPATEEGIIKQRQRWEQGSLAMLMGSGVKTAVHGLRSRNWPLLALAFDMMVPPLTLHAAAVVVLLLLSGSAYLLGLVSPLPGAIALGSFALFAAAMLISWVSFGRGALPLSLWPRLFQFALAKFKIYKGFSVRGRREWVRGDRNTKE